MGITYKLHDCQREATPNPSGVRQTPTMSYQWKIQHSSGYVCANAGLKVTSTDKLGNYDMMLMGLAVILA